MFRSLVLATLLLAAPALSKPPKLTVFIVVDSLGSDLLLRSRPQFHAGLKTLLDGGAYYPYARYEYAQPMTAAGHTTLSTGANPWKHGIVGNKVFNRVTGKEEKPFSDAAHPLLEAPLSADDVSPENLMVETLSDRLREFTRGRGKAVALSLKGRAAIPLAGRQGQAYWFSSQVGKFVTGTYYAKEFRRGCARSTTRSCRTATTARIGPCSSRRRATWATTTGLTRTARWRWGERSRTPSPADSPRWGSSTTTRSA